MRFPHCSVRFSEAELCDLLKYNGLVVGREYDPAKNCIPRMWIIYQQKEGLRLATFRG